MKRFVLTTLLALLAISSVRADLIWYDGFNYTNGFVQYASTNLWVTNSVGGGGSSNDMFVANHRLEVSATGGATVTRVNDCNRSLAVTSGSIYTNSPQVLYASLTVICTNRPAPSSAGTYFASFYSTAATGGGYYGRIYATTNGAVVANTWRLAVSGTTTAFNHVYPVDLATNVPYQVVAQLDPVTLKAISLWVNPVTSADASTSSSDVPTVTANIDSFAFRQASGFGNAFFQITNLALATTFSEAATNVWATNAVAPAIVYQPLGTTNFTGATLTLSAVANGQGLGNLAYQWQQNGTNYPGSVNTNILIIGSAQVTDNGNFTLVVTTPFGLSATSSVAKLSISTAPVPPSFVTQPVSQTVYRGQSVTFSTTVISPGNLFYQWKSNNVDIAGANSSTLTLNNVASNFAASYRVAVTNDVVTNGIVSTNAVLTVLNPPSVSIAYLRTLVDSTTYQPTNSPPTLPYQVTGVITTFTNITSGDTASYYLQDATAGIDIFATFGSTFRPAQGDVVTFVGVLSFFSTTGIELLADTQGRTYTSYNIVSNNFPLPTPRLIPYDATNSLGYAYVATNLAGSLVTLTNVYFGTNAGTVISASGNTSVIVTNISGLPFKIQFFSQDQDTAGQTLPDFASSVTGVFYGGHPDYSLGVTKFSDIVTNSPAVPIPLGVSFSAGTLTFNWSDASFGLQSATNVMGPYTTISGAATGFSTNTTSDQMYFRLVHP